MLVTLAGILRLVRPVLWNACDEIVVRVLGRVIFVRAVHPIKACDEIVVTVLGRVILVSAVQF